MSEIKRNIQRNIAKYRKEAKLTQKELAEKLSIAPTNVASWEQGKSLPDIDTLFSVCKILNVTIIDMYELAAKDYSDLGLSGATEAINDLANRSARAGSELSTSTLSSDEQQLIDDYRSLNSQGQEYIRQTMFMAKQAYKKMPDISPMENQA